MDETLIRRSDKAEGARALRSAVTELTETVDQSHPSLRNVRVLLSRIDGST
jgi:hypothetical protein